MNYLAYLLPGEHILVEVKLELLVSNIDAELLKRIVLAILESKNVKNTNTVQLLTSSKYQCIFIILITSINTCQLMVPV